MTTKYNPARPWTPENAVGIGGAYMCIYGMEGPGGYQLFGRTIQVWNTHRQTPPFAPGHPWLLRHFDRIRFFEVTEAELAEARAAFPYGKYPLRIEDSTFSLAAYETFRAANAAGINAFQATQHAAFAAEREDWARRGLNTFEEPDATPPPEELPLPAGAKAISATVPGSVWQILVAPDGAVQAGDAVMVIESMKMEVRVLAAASGVVTLAAAAGQVVRAGQRLGFITPAPVP